MADFVYHGTAMSHLCWYFINNRSKEEQIKTLRVALSLAIREIVYHSFRVQSACEIFGPCLLFEVQRSLMVIKGSLQQRNGGKCAQLSILEVILGSF